MDSSTPPPLSPSLSVPPGAATPTLEDMDRLYAELAHSRHTIALHEAALRAAELKIQALVLELAHHKRLRFGQTSEALANAGQRDLFDETRVADQAAIEAELERLVEKADPAPRKPRVRAGRQPLRRTCRESSIATNPHPAPVAGAGPP